MSISVHELASFTDNLLEIKHFKDYCPNGLQVEASDKIEKIITGVTASQALIEEAIKRKADALLVHHGYFWRGEAEVLVGIKGQRIRSLIENKISLLAYHLPLDAHPVLGNNAQLAKLLGFDVIGGVGVGDRPIALQGRLNEPSSLGQLGEKIEAQLVRKPQVFGEGSKLIEKVAWCTGAAQSYFEQAVAAGVDCFITGEVSEQTYHLAQETGVAFIAAGHHATERYGAKALGQYLSEKFVIDVEFVDIDNPV